jgi:arsenite/tail-anchored protein-transporting ATPase
VPVGGGTLYAVEIDAKKSLAGWLAGRRATFERIALGGTWLDREDVSRLLQLSMPGIDELAALFEIARAGNDRRFQSIVIDTAPTGHTLRMLEMPETLRALAQVFDRMQEKHRIMVEALTGTYAPDDSDRLIAEIDRMARDLAAFLRDPAIARVSWVTLAEPMSVQETVAAAAALARSAIPLADLIVNRVTPEPLTRCRRCHARRAVEHESIEHLRKTWPDMTAAEVGARTREPRGVRMLHEIGREIAHRSRSHQTLQGRRPPRWRARLLGAHARIEHLRGAPSARLVLFGGKGGVGKTTCATAAALTIASQTRRPVLLLSTDPAHSLGDVLGQRVTAAPRPLRSGPPSLRVRGIDAAREFARMRARYATAIDALFDRLARGGSGSVRVDASHDRNVMRGLIELAPPGIDELAAIVEVAETIESEPGQTIVVDTAPTGHVLRLLEMPALIHAWTKALMGILLKYQPLGGIEEFGPVLLKLSRGLGRLQRLLADPQRTSFVVVTRAAALPREETRDLVRHLGRLNIHVQALVVNAAGYGTCQRCRVEARDADRHLKAIKLQASRAMPVLIAPSELPPPRGVLALRQWQHRWVFVS